MAKKNKHNKKNVLKEKKSNSSGNRFAFNRKYKNITGISLLFLTIFLFIAFLSYIITWKLDDIIFGSDDTFWNALTDSNIQSKNITGKLGAYLSLIFIKRGLGIGAFFIIISLAIISINILNIKIKKFYYITILLILWAFYSPILFATLFQNSDLETLKTFAGIFGTQSYEFIKSIIGVGHFFFMLVAGLLLLYFSFPPAYKRIKNFFELKNNISPVENNITAENVHSEDNMELELSDNITKKSISDEPVENDENTGDDYDQHQSNNVAPYDPTSVLSSYKFPEISLLFDYDEEKITINKEEQEENKKKIKKTLGNYDIEIDKISATVGPTITLYEIIPAAGVRISKIKNLEDDIALSLSAFGIRIIAPIPGKGTIGIEVPNEKPGIVSLKSLINSKQFIETNYELPIALGKTITNEPFIADLTKMPHLLMAGATGQGKSVSLNAIITSLLYKKHPAELKLILIDPKKVELPIFSKIERHFLAKLPHCEEAIITNTKQIIKTLKALTIEMEERYDLFNDAHVRNIKEYNSKFIARKLNPNEHKFLTYIVLIIDEFADLIMTSGREVEIPLARIAQLARATGIHLIIATQRPSVNIITGIIKANFPVRLAFKVSAKVDSRTILDTSGAEQLIGRGDLLITTGSTLTRLQGAYVDVDELEKITEFIGSQRGFPDAFLLPEVLSDEDNGIVDLDIEDRDPMFEEAARMIVQNQHGSTSLIQRKLKLGYNRAGRIIDQLEAAGIVGPFEGSKAREVLIKDFDTLEQLLKQNRV